VGVLTCNPQELQRVKDALVKNANNVGVGMLHEPTGQISLEPFNDLQGGHDQLVARKQLVDADCKGFVVVRLADGSFDAVNNSHLNGPQGQPGSLFMPAAVFQAIVRTLRQAGL
jgi:hypothetical protein